MAGIIKERLFTPGPTPVLAEAQARTLTATLHHRTESFRHLLGETLENLKYFFNTKNDVLIFTSSGTGAMEGAITNLLSPGDRVLVGTAGKFGERWLELAAAYGIEAVKVEAPYGQALDMGEMGKRLKSEGPFRAVPGEVEAVPHRTVHLAPGDVRRAVPRLDGRRGGGEGEDRARAVREPGRRGARVLGAPRRA